MSLMMMMEEDRIRLTGAKIFKIGISLIPPVFLIYHFRCNIVLSLDASVFDLKNITTCLIIFRS